MEKLDRKDFLKLAGGTIAGVAAGSAVGATLSGAPFLSAQWVVEWTQDQYVPPRGNEKFVNSIYGTFPASSEVSVKMVENRAVKINSTLHGGDAQLALQLLYHPDRIQTPLKRTGKKGFDEFEEISWEEAIREISSKIDELVKGNRSKSMAAIDSGRGGLSSLLMERMIFASGSPNFYSEPSLENLSAKAVKLTQSADGSIQYDLENADFVITFGARIFEGWGHSVEMIRAFNALKKNGAKIIHVDSMSNRTGSLADRWIAVKPGTETVLALGIANQLIKNGRGGGNKNYAEFVKIANQYTPEEVSKITGVAAADIEKLAAEFASSQRPVAVAGSGSAEIGSTVAEIAAVQCVNALVGNLGNKGGVFVRVHPGIGRINRPEGGNAGLDDFIKNNKDLDLLFINEANPAYKSAYGKDLVEMMKKASMVISIMPLKNDTAIYSDYVLPSISALEMENLSGELPIAPRYKSMFGGDAIINIARKTISLANYFTWNDHNDAVKTMEPDEIKAVKDFTFPAGILKEYYANTIKRTAISADYPLIMMPFSLQAVGDGSGLAFPYVLKGIDETILLGRTLWVQMNPDTAEKFDLCEGSKIDIVSERGKLKKLRVHLTKTVAPDVVAIPLGFGQKANTKYAADKGSNPKEIMSAGIDPVSGVADWWLTRVKIS
ncbi:MAG: molybdopterin-dependent oxidoreductase [Spirochaetes bacterium]|jgi:anaerobic selenocysteine-containing dehydrogenase|nr:molybdopterin-dependent oxidoreductase [Spirochaetota bacterium]